MKVNAIESTESINAKNSNTSGFEKTRKLFNAAALGTLISLGGNVSCAHNVMSVGKDNTPPPTVGLNTSNNNTPGRINCAIEKCVALTFDDGPGPYTERLLNILENSNAKATFFVIGNQVYASQDLLRRMIIEGHTIGTHTMTHPNLNTLSKPAIKTQLTDSKQRIEDIIGQDVNLFRPPYGNANNRVVEVSKELGLSIILWDVDTLDWKTRNTGKNIHNATTNVHPGSIILMHDIHKSSVDAVNQIIQILKNKGYSLVTVPELFHEGELVPGKKYTQS